MKLNIRSSPEKLAASQPERRKKWSGANRVDSHLCTFFLCLYFPLHILLFVSMIFLSLQTFCVCIVFFYFQVFLFVRMIFFPFKILFFCAWYSFIFADLLVCLFDPLPFFLHDSWLLENLKE